MQVENTLTQSSLLQEITPLYKTGLTIKFYTVAEEPYLITRSYTTGLTIKYYT
jgi:hypothetical protein